MGGVSPKKTNQMNTIYGNIEMTEIYKNLYVGSLKDCHRSLIGNAFVIHACKEPCHRKFLGYAPGKPAPKDSPGSLVAIFDNNMYLNLVDSPDPKYIPSEIMNTALQAIKSSLDIEQSVFIHCNKGESRSPAIALLYLWSINQLNGSYDNVLKQFKEIYPGFRPGKGIEGYLKKVIEGGD